MKTSGFLGLNVVVVSVIKFQYCVGLVGVVLESLLLLFLFLLDINIFFGESLKYGSNITIRE